MKILKFSELEMGTTKEMILLVSGMKERLTKNGNKFVTVELSDGEKKNPINFFDSTVDSLEKQGLKENSIIRIMISKTQNKGGFFYNQDGWRIMDDSRVSVNDFARVAPINLDKGFSLLLSKIEALDENISSNNPYMNITKLTLALLKEHAEEFKKSSAAVSMHHNYLGGLLYHTCRMVCLADKVCDTYKILDKTLLLCGAALHDIGKLVCYNTVSTGEASVTVEGRLLDHVLVGIKMIEEESKKGIYDPEKLMMLKHMLASHHGRLEWGALVTPAIPEATALHLIDLFDSKMNMFEEAEKDLTPGALSVEKVFGLDNSYIYKPIH